MDRKIGVIGLGYVGLPVAVAFGAHSRVVGYDINEQRIKELRDGIDITEEVSDEELKNSDVLYTTDPSKIKEADFIIVTVPTPIDEAKRPVLAPLIHASEVVGKNLSKGSIVVYESTVYPGVTENICLSILEKESGLKAGIDFKVGYSPERINPGDKERRFTKIKKVVSGQDEECLDIIVKTYEQVIEAGVHKASSIKVAEAAKVIENTQRDLNIALMNELSVIFNKLDIDTLEVLKAANTKWNFLPFKPGLVGGHCIGVDPYYLTHLAESIGYHPQVILAGRKINDSMGYYIATESVKKLSKQGLPIHGAKVLFLGITFKEDCPDIRNSKVIDIVNELSSFGCDITVHDPMADKQEILKEFNLNLKEDLKGKKFDMIIGAVTHKIYREMGIRELKELVNTKSVIVDVKGMWNKKEIEASGLMYWRL